MEQQIFTLIKDITIPGVFALAILLVAKPLIPSINLWIKSKIRNEVVNDDHRQAINKVGADLKLIGTNHLHEIKDTLGQILASQLRIESAMTRSSEISRTDHATIKESLIYIRARLNGKS